MGGLHCAVGAPQSGASATAQAIACATSCGLTNGATDVVQLIRLIQCVPVGCLSLVVLRTRHGHHARPVGLGVLGCLNWCRRWRWWRLRCWPVWCGYGVCTMLDWCRCRCRCWSAQISTFCQPFFGPQGHVADTHFKLLFVFCTSTSTFWQVSGVSGVQPAWALGLR